MCDSVNTHISNVSFSDPVSSWVTPNAVMKSRKMKAKRQALKARLNGSLPLHPRSKPETHCDKDIFSGLQRNPFKCSFSKKPEESSPVDDNDCSNLFQLLESQHKLSQRICNSSRLSNSLVEDYDDSTNIKNVLDSRSSHFLCVDWCLKSRMRIQSSNSLPWKHTFKTSEEASGTTGFVRCLNSKTEEPEQRTLDTSSNAQFYQCCLLWQSPNLPLVSLFPRNKTHKSTALGGIYGSDPDIAKALHTEWSESLRSLYQLLRVRQCPYFYICASTFTCLFRAAGVAGFPHSHALITPTTKGFRSAIKNEGVEFSMPLIKRSGPAGDESTGGGKEATHDNSESEEEPLEFLETLGLETSQFPTLNNSRLKSDNKVLPTIDKSPESLVYVEDMELQGLINFFLNCASCVSTTGSLAGVPPTLLAPVAFHGATLKSLKVSGGTVRTPKGETHFSLDIQGPILPTTIVQISSLLSSSTDDFSLSFSPLTDSLPFCSVAPCAVGTSVPMAFAMEGLIDCGMNEELRKVLCTSPDILNDTGLPSSYREVIFSKKSFTWSNKLELKS